MTTPLKTAVIGCGGFSAAHLSKLRDMDCFELAGVADVDEAAARSRADEFGVPHWKTDHRAFLNETEVEGLVASDKYI